MIWFVIYYLIEFHSSNFLFRVVLITSKLLQILSHSVKRIFKSKFSYITQMNSRYYDISETDMKEFVSNHIIIWGYNKGCNQFIESIREETNIPIVIISDSSKRAEIINATRVYTNTFYFKGNPLTIEHLKNANIAESFHVIIPSKTEDIINENDWNAVIKANMIKQNWPEVKISVEFNSNTKALLIENLINYNVEWNNNSSAYLNKCYIGGKIFSSVLFSRLSAIKSLRIESYQTITALLKYCTCSSNLMIIEIPDDLKQKQELLYGDVKEFLLLNSKISLLSIGVYIPDDDAQRKSYNFDKDANNGNIIFDLEQNSDIVRQSIAVGKIKTYIQHFFYKL